MEMTPLHILTLVCGYLICVILGVLAYVVLREMYLGNIDLSRLISEPNGDASMSRFQFLVFTFVIAFSLFLVVVATLAPGTALGPHFPEVPGTILVLLGISGSSYLVSKSIQFSDPAGLVDRSLDTVITIAPKKILVRYGQTQQFAAQVPNDANAKLKWQVIAGGGTIDANGLYTAPATPPPAAPSSAAAPDAGAPAAAAGGAPAAAAAAPAPPVLAHATIQVTCDEYPEIYDLAVVTLS
jgi:hypothetical protein